MKSFITLFILFIGLTFIGCTNSNTKKEVPTATEEIDKSGKEYTSNYICPMHCKDSGSDQGGECSVCGMDYVANKDKGHSHDGHDHSHDGHDHSHDGHDHSHEGHDHNHDGHDHSHDGHDHSHDGHDHSHDGHDHSHEGHNH